MTFANENLCYVLWKLKFNREEWPIRLAEWAKCSLDRAEELLQNAMPGYDEQINISKVLNIPEEDLQYSRMLVLDDVDILYENVRFLLDQLPRGKKKDLAEYISVHATTLTKWLSKEQLPTPTHQAGLRRYYSIADDRNLARDPLFLSPFPVIDLGRRTWLHKQIDRLSSTTLEELFPALMRLLKGK